MVNGGDKEERSSRLVTKVYELGLQPYHPPKPLDEIDEDEVQLVCWMVVEENTTHAVSMSSKKHTVHSA